MNAHINSICSPKILLLAFIFVFMLNAKGQETEDSTPEETGKKFKAAKGKPVMYNAFGAGLDLGTAGVWENKMVGGNHVSYRKLGFGLSWRFGIKNYEEMKKGISMVTYENAVIDSMLTSKYFNTYSYSIMADFVFKITKKIPIYIGAGVIRQRQFVEIYPPWKNPGETEWTINPNEVKFVPNFTAGVFVPLFSRLVLNVGYDHVPQMVFVGLSISGPYNYQDIDMW